MEEKREFKDYEEISPVDFCESLQEHVFYSKSDIKYWVRCYVMANSLAGKSGEALFVLFNEASKRNNDARLLYLESFVQEFAKCYMRKDKGGVLLDIKPECEKNGDFKKKAKFICHMFEDIYAEEIKEARKEIKEELAEFRKSAKDAKDVGRGK